MNIVQNVYIKVWVGPIFPRSGSTCAPSAASAANFAERMPIGQGVIAAAPKDVCGVWSVAMCESAEQPNPSSSTHASACELEWWRLLPRPQHSCVEDYPFLHAAFQNQYNQIAAEWQRATALATCGGLNLAPDVTTRFAFRRQDFVTNAARYWDIFYKHNTVNFFKDRHWLDREFPEIGAIVAKKGTGRNAESGRNDQAVLVECGCGVGNALFPLMDAHPSLFCYACDFSPRAIRFVQQHPSYCANRCCAFVHDITQGVLSSTPCARTARPVDSLASTDLDSGVSDGRDAVLDGAVSAVPIASGTVDVVLLCFVLSAVAPETHREVVANILPALRRPGALILFRDYAFGDQAQGRFKSTSKLSLEGSPQFVRHDGTLTYFFRKEEVANLFEEEGLTCLSAEYIEKDVSNRKQGMTMSRRYVQAKLIYKHSE
eukprot:SAG31_NODE_4150_length_3528_cov_4.950714_3_plen_431_part_00